MSKDEAWLLREKYHGEQTADFFADCDKLAAGEPLAYIIGSIPFLHSTITLASRPLIPRPETEYWVEHFITSHPNLDESSVLDLCAGSGCIGVAVGQAFPSAQIDFCELDVRHSGTIHNNWSQNTDASRHPSIFIGNLFEPLPTDARYDYILSNPPYIDATLGRVEPSVATFEPATALYGGAQGLEIIERIISEAPSYLTAHGELWLEHEPEQSEAIVVAGRAAGFLPHTHTDQYGIKRYTVLVLQ